MTNDIIDALRFLFETYQLVLLETSYFAEGNSSAMDMPGVHIRCRF